MKNSIFVVCALTLILGSVWGFYSWKYNKTIIVIENQTSELYENVEVVTAQNNAKVRALPPYSRAIVILNNPIVGESGVRIIYGDMLWEGGYVVDKSRVKVVLREGGEVDFSESSLKNIIFGI